MPELFSVDDDAIILEVSISPVRHEDCWIEPKVEGMIGKEVLMSSLHSVPNGNIEEDDSGIRIWDFFCELRANKVSIEVQLFRTVGENKSSCPRGEVPSWRPLGSSSNTPFHLSDSKADFCIANACLSLFSNCGMLQRWEEVVEIKDFPPEDSFPLGRWDSFRHVSGSSNGKFGSGNVFVVDSEESACFLIGNVIAVEGRLIWVKQTHLRLFDFGLLLRGFIDIVWFFTRRIITLFFSMLNSMGDLIEDFMYWVIDCFLLFRYGHCK